MHSTPPHVKSVQACTREERPNGLVGVCPLAIYSKCRAHANNNVTSASVKKLCIVYPPPFKSVQDCTREERPTGLVGVCPLAIYSKCRAHAKNNITSATVKKLCIVQPPFLKCLGCTRKETPDGLVGVCPLATYSKCMPRIMSLLLLSMSCA